MKLKGAKITVIPMITTNIKHWEYETRSSDERVYMKEYWDTMSWFRQKLNESMSL